MNKSVKILSQIAIIFQFFGMQFFSVGNLFPKRNVSKKSKLFSSVNFLIHLLILFIMLYRVEDIIKTHASEIQSNKNHHINMKIFRGVMAILTFTLLIVLKLSETIGSKIKEDMLIKFYVNCLEIQQKFETNFQQNVSFLRFRNLMFLKFFLLLAAFIASLSKSFTFSNTFVFLVVDIMAVMTYFSFIFKFGSLVEFANNLYSNLIDVVDKCVEDPKLLENSEIPNEYFQLKWKKSATKIQKLRSIYSTVKENSSFINKLSNYSIFSSVSLIFLTTTSFGHGVLLGAINEKFEDSNFIRDVFIAFSTLWFLFYICNSCQKSENLNEKMIFQLNRLYTKHFKILSRSDRCLVCDLIKNIQNEPVEFSLAGLYTLNMKFFASVSYIKFSFNQKKHKMIFIIVSSWVIIKPVHLISV